MEERSGRRYVARLVQFGVCRSEIPLRSSDGIPTPVAPGIVALVNKRGWVVLLDWPQAN
jgi:hypothetical protein